MSAHPLVLVPAASPAFGGRRPASLAPVLGDPSLLWVLRALPESQEAALLVHAEPEVALAATTWSSQGLLPRPVFCIQVPAGKLEAMLLAAEHAVTPLSTHGVGLCLGDAPLLPAARYADLLQHEALPWNGIMSAFRRGTTMTDLLPEAWLALQSDRLSNRQALAEVECKAQALIAEGWMAKGVTIQNPASSRIGPRVVLAPEVVVESGVRLEGVVTVGEGTLLGQGSILRDCTVGAQVIVRPYTVAEQAQIGPKAQIGPFAHLRPGTVLDEEVHMGNFVETKKAHLKRGAKANHLSYLGDAEIGEGTNIGAGCITCNYDGVNKHRTVIGPRVFVGSDCQLVAPVTLGEGSLIAAGTTVTRDVPAHAIAIARPELELKEGAAQRLRERLAAASS